jgi:uncharacterized protein YutE (UPF0331/DUF86 family)
VVSSTAWRRGALVDPERVRDRLGRLSRMLSVLEAVRGAGKEAYLDDLDMRLKSERALQLAVQICIDIGAHLIAELGLDQPDDYRGVFEVLKRADLIDADLADSLGEAAGQRNLLVHGYADIEDTQIWASLARLDDLRAFAAAAERAISDT